MVRVDPRRKLTDRSPSERATLSGHPLGLFLAGFCTFGTVGRRTMPRGGGNLKLSVSQLLVVGALILTVVDLLHLSLLPRGLPLLPLAVLLLCLAWLVP